MIHETDIARVTAEARRALDDYEATPEAMGHIKAARAKSALRRCRDLVDLLGRSRMEGRA